MATPEGKKKVAALIVAGMPPPGKMKDKPAPMDEDVLDGGADDAEEEDGKQAAEESAFADLRSALASKDDKAGAAAFKEFLDLCGYGKSGE